MIYREKMLCCFLLLFTLTSCVSGSPVVNVTQSSYQAEENHDVTLEWRFSIRTDGSLNSINVFCQLLTVKKAFILFHLREGVEVSESQDERFAGRVQVDKEVLRRGRLRLHVSRLRTDDSGDYVCRVNAGDGFASKECHLKVTAARDRTKPERTNTTSGPSQPKSRGRIGLFCVLGLILLGIFWCFYNCLCTEPFFNRKHFKYGSKDSLTTTDSSGSSNNEYETGCEWVTKTCPRGPYNPISPRVPLKGYPRASTGVVEHM